MKIVLDSVFNQAYRGGMLNKANRKKIASRLEEYRLERKWTLQQLATVTNMSVGGIHKIISRQSTPTALTVRKLADALPSKAFQMGRRGRPQQRLPYSLAP